MAWIFDGSGASAVWTTDPFGTAPTALDVRAAISLADWTPATAMTVVSQSLLLNDGTGGQLAGGLFAFGIDGSGGGALTGGSGELWVYLPVWPTDQYFYGSGAAVPASANDVYCIRFTFSDTANEVKFWYKATTAGNAEADMAAHTGWTQLGSTDTHSYSLTASGDILLLGKDVWSPDTYHFDGTFYAASAATSVGGSALASAESSEAGTAASWVSSTGETWYTEDYTGPPPILADISTADRWSISPTWVTLDGYITAIATTRRASVRQLGQVIAGTAQVTVNNTDRAFDPSYTSGPFGTWVPGRRVRLRTVHAGVTYGLLEGYIANLPQTYSYESPYHGQSTLTLIDAWADLSQQDIGAPDWAYAVIDALSPTAWWRMGDNGAQIATIGTSFGGSATPPPTTGLAPGLPISASSFNGHDLNVRMDFTDSSTQSLSLWIKTSTAADTGQQRVIWSSQAQSNGVTWGSVISILSVTDAGTLYIETTTPTGTAATAATTTSVITDGLAHHIAVVSGPSTTSLWIDGVPAIVAAIGVGRLAFDDAALILGAVGAVPSGQAFIGTISDVAFWSGTALSSANIAAIVAAGNGYDGDNTGTRIARVLDSVGWPDGWRTVASGKDAAGPQSSDVSAAEMMRVAHSCEGGLLFIDRDGGVRFRNRYWFAEETTGNTSQATFSDDGAAGAIEWQSGGFDWDVEEWLTNQVTVTGSNGVSAREVDATVVASRAITVSTALRTSASCGSLARKILRHRAGALLVARPWSGRPQGDEWATVLALELGDRVTFEVTPWGVGSQIAREMTVAAIRHSISRGRFDWEVTIEGDPIDANNYLVLGTGTLGAAGGYVLG